MDVNPVIFTDQLQIKPARNGTCEGWGKGSAWQKCLQDGARVHEHVN